MVHTRGRDGRIRHAGVGRGVSMPVEQEQDIEQPVIVEQPMMQEDVAQHGWPGGPLDTSLLTRYADHVAHYIWFGTERIEGPKPELRIASLGAKLTGWVPGHHHPNIQGWLDESGLKWLERTSLSRVDPQILSAFTERWHPETSSFHMPFGEMTITLDDVACLLHIPIRAPSYTDIDSLSSGYHTYVDRILQLTHPVRFDAETTADYLPWYYTLSHPIMCRPHDGPHGAPPVPQFVPAYAPPEADPVPQDAPTQDAPPAHAPPSGEQRRMDAIVSALERFIAQVDADRDDDVFGDIFYALDVVCGD
ncbi:hypothetical protein TSUD_88920 [Trifolium subterraneum]|uniref:Aminotransferase-like plant mobile domain-containing protein n=1 Tax=Trifolium subterraneum TaxID=3900 RepID=A0A2Z6PGJ0_TRISU|nr:hypothetical protein TSUD_88920 [Trifolium subterraneum]